MNEQPGLLGKKLGMTQIFLDDGTRVPVTVVLVQGNTVTAHRTLARDGYTALQVGFGERKATRATKADLGRFAAAQVKPQQFVREFRCPAAQLEQHPVGSVLAVPFAEGDLVDVTGTSKGKGFQGVMKRHKMSGKPNTHGTHEYFRHGGSVGMRKTPGRVLPGKRMGGRMGGDRITEQNLKIAKVLPEQGVILVRGPVPGSNNSYVTIRGANKPAIRKRHAATG
jgi:large subunit ribosomal protein L3